MSKECKAEPAAKTRGRNAFEDGRPLNENPYEEDDVRAGLWDLGWYAAACLNMEIQNAEIVDLSHLPTDHPDHPYQNGHWDETCNMDDSKKRKDTPLYSGCIAYFPDALAAVAQLSKYGNDKHNPGQPLHWSREKSGDHKDCIARHLAECGKIDPETGMLHDVAVAWRALANLQIALENKD